MKTNAADTAADEEDEDAGIDIIIALLVEVDGGE